VCSTTINACTVNLEIVNQISLAQILQTSAAISLNAVWIVAIIVLTVKCVQTQMDASSKMVSVNIRSTHAVDQDVQTLPMNVPSLQPLTQRSLLLHAVPTTVLCVKAVVNVRLLLDVFSTTISATTPTTLAVDLVVPTLLSSAPILAPLATVELVKDATNVLMCRDVFLMVPSVMLLTTHAIIMATVPTILASATSSPSLLHLIRLITINAVVITAVLAMTVTAVLRKMGVSSIITNATIPTILALVLVVQISQVNVTTLVTLLDTPHTIPLLLDTLPIMSLLLDTLPIMSLLPITQLITTHQSVAIINIIAWTV